MTKKSTFSRESIKEFYTKVECFRDKNNIIHDTEEDAKQGALLCQFDTWYSKHGSLINSMCNNSWNKVDICKNVYLWLMKNKEAISSLYQLFEEVTPNKKSSKYI